MRLLYEIDLEVLVPAVVAALLVAIVAPLAPTARPIVWLLIVASAPLGLAGIMLLVRVFDRGRTKYPLVYVLLNLAIVALCLGAMLCVKGVVLTLRV